MVRSGHRSPPGFDDEVPMLSTHDQQFIDILLHWHSPGEVQLRFCRNAHYQGL